MMMRRSDQPSRIMTAPVYDMDQAADRLHKSRRWLQDWLRGHPADQFGQPFYSPMGRTKTFDDADLVRIRAAAKEDERCRLNSFRRRSKGAHRLLRSRHPPWTLR